MARHAPFRGSAVFPALRLPTARSSPNGSAGRRPAPAEVRAESGWNRARHGNHALRAGRDHCATRSRAAASGRALYSCPRSISAMRVFAVVTLNGCRESRCRKAARAPDRQDHVDRFGEPLVAVLVQQAERFGVRAQGAGLTPKMNRRAPGDRHRRRARRSATGASARGWRFRWRVDALRRVNSWRENEAVATFSDFSVRCSPTNES